MLVDGRSHGLSGVLNMEKQGVVFRSAILNVMEVVNRKIAVDNLGSKSLGRQLLLGVL